jgi:hypothetical protein
METIHGHGRPGELISIECLAKHRDSTRFNQSWSLNCGRNRPTVGEIVAARNRGSFTDKRFDSFVRLF